MKQLKELKFSNYIPFLSDDGITVDFGAVTVRASNMAADNLTVGCGFSVNDCGSVSADVIGARTIYGCGFLLNDSGISARTIYGCGFLLNDSGISADSATFHTLDAGCGALYADMYGQVKVGDHIVIGCGAFYADSCGQATVYDSLAVGCGFSVSDMCGIACDTSLRVGCGFNVDNSANVGCARLSVGTSIEAMGGAYHFSSESGAGTYYTYMKFGSGSPAVVKSGYVYPDSDGVLRLLSSKPV